LRGLWVYENLQKYELEKTPNKNNNIYTKTKNQKPKKKNAHMYIYTKERALMTYKLIPCLYTRLFEGGKLKTYSEAIRE